MQGTLGQTQRTTRSVNYLKRQLLLTISLALFVTSVAPSSQAGTGLRLGGGISDAWGVAGDSLSRDRFSAVLGVFKVIHINEFFELQPELDIATKSFSREYTSVIPHGQLHLNEVDKLLYLEAAVLFKLPFPLGGKFRPSVYLGPAIGVNLWSKVEGSYYATGNDRVGPGSFSGSISNIRRIDPEFTFGGDLSIAAGTSYSIVLDCRYLIGLRGVLSPVSDYTSVDGNGIAIIDPRSGEGLDFRNGVFAITLGFCWK